MNQPDMVNFPPHYLAHPSGIESIEITRQMGFNLGNSFKYVFRAEHKNGNEDYKKARWYLTDVMHNYYAERGRIPTDLLRRVAAAEPDGSLQQQYFNAIADGALGKALEALNEMISWEA